MKEPAKILLIDDDKDFVAATRMVLESKSYRIVVAYSSREGLSRLKEERPDLIILDVMMEGKAAGFLLAREIRKSPEFATVPILMLTGMREQTGFFFPGEAKHQIFLPVDEFVEKPLEPKELLGKVGEMLKQKTLNTNHQNPNIK